MGMQGEADRLESQNRVFNILFDGKLIFPPVTDIKRVLDCGYGAGSWAIEVSEGYPDSEVRLYTPNNQVVLILMPGHWR